MLLSQKKTWKRGKSF